MPLLEKVTSSVQRGCAISPTALGVGISLSGLNPISALYWAAVINAVISVPVMVAVMLAASRKKIMGDLVLPRRWKVLGWLATAAMAAATAAMFVAMS
jgi:Mn2+/Fe2+ NRAMP family transporter